VTSVARISFDLLDWSLLRASVYSVIEVAACERFQSGSHTLGLWSQERKISRTGHGTPIIAVRSRYTLG
jgi:hypothetical protein